MDFNYEIKIINKKHHKYKQILKMINVLVEHGIKQRVDYLNEYGIVMLFYLFEKLSNSKVLNQIKYEMNKKVTKSHLVNFQMFLPYCLLHLHFYFWLSLLNVFIINFQ